MSNQKICTSRVVSMETEQWTEQPLPQNKNAKKKRRKKKRFTAYLFIFSARKEKEKKKKEKKHGTNYELFSCQRDVGELFDHPCGVSDNHPGSCPPHQPAGGLPEQRSPGGARVTALRFKSQQRRFCFCPADSSYNPNWALSAERRLRASRRQTPARGVGGGGRQGNNNKKKWKEIKGRRGGLMGGGEKKTNGKG